MSQTKDNGPGTEMEIGAEELEEVVGGAYVDPALPGTSGIHTGIWGTGGTIVDGPLVHLNTFDDPLFQPLGDSLIKK